MKYLLKYSLALLLLSSCRKEPNFPDEPQITYNGVEQYTTREPGGRDIDELILRIGYQDGDGDLGLSRDRNTEDYRPPFNSGSQYEHNFIAELQVKQGDRYIPYPFVGPLGFSGRFPRLTNGEGRAEALEGEIRYTIESFASDTYDQTGTLSDTIRFQIYIYDRALNKSNVILTDDIKLFSGSPRP